MKLTARNSARDQRNDASANPISASALLRILVAAPLRLKYVCQRQYSAFACDASVQRMKRKVTFILTFRTMAHMHRRVSVATTMFMCWRRHPCVYKADLPSRPGTKPQNRYKHTGFTSVNTKGCSPRDALSRACSFLKDRDRIHQHISDPSLFQY